MRYVVISDGAAAAATGAVSAAEAYLALYPAVIVMLLFTACTGQ